MKKISRAATRSPLVLAKKSLAIAQAALPVYSSKFSRHDFTQPQLFSCLVLKEFLHTDFRSLIALLTDFEELRQTLGLAKVPDHSTLVKARKRLGKARALTPL